MWASHSTVPEKISRCVHSVIHDIAVNHPTRPAVCAWNGDLTYGELDAFATQLAHHLVGLGVRPGDVVPVCFEKSRWAVVATLGVLKAGGAFMLLDTAQPEGRLRGIVQQVNANVICSSLEQTSLCQRLAPNTVVISPDVVQNGYPGTMNEETILPEVDPSSPMYLVFTSGSTGTPKGVVIHHSAFCSAMYHQLEGMGYTPDTRVFDFATYSFDIAVLNNYGGLSAGACICVPSDIDRKSDLAASITALQATSINLTASVARLIDPDSVPTLDTLILCGEPVTLYDTTRWWGKLKVVSAYGPSECTPIQTINPTARDPAECTKLGKGVGAVTWIVDPSDHNKLLPIGEVGEIVMEGPVVGSGYWGDAEKTKSAFIQDPPWLVQDGPTWKGRHGLVYKTGDLGRYDEDGGLIFHGRKDTQIKIRGQRIELGEVEHNIRVCVPGAKDVVAEVIIPAGENANPTLAAFVRIGGKTCEDDTTPICSPITPTAPPSLISVPSNIDENLFDRLPSYMVPTAYFRVGDIPHTNNGKTDRKRLRETGASFSAQQLADVRTATGEKKRAPVTKAERQLQGLWASVLNIGADSIGLDDSFFRLGGNSITAIRLIGEARASGLSLTVADIFREPKLVDQARASIDCTNQTEEAVPPFSLLEGRIDEDAQSFCDNVAQRYGIDRASIVDAYPVTPLQYGFFLTPVNRPDKYIEVKVMELSQNIDIDTFRAAWEKVARSTAILRTRVVEHEKAGLLQLVVQEGIEWLEVKAPLHDYLVQDRSTPMPMGDRITRFALVHDPAANSSKPRWFVWTAHHAVTDGWTQSLVTQMVERAYRGESIGDRPEYNTFVKHRLALKDEDINAYWESHFAEKDLGVFPQLPPSSGRPVANKFVERECVVTLDSKAVDVTRSTLMRGALGLLISRYTGATDVVFGDAVAGRNAAVDRVWDIVGPFVMAVIVPVEVNGEQTVAGYLDGLQQQATEMITYEQTGFWRIARTGPGGRRAAGMQTLLIMRPEELQPRTGLEFGDWIPDTMEPDASPFALSLEIIISKDAVKFRACYDSNVLEQVKTMEVLEQLEFVVQQLSNAQPDQKISDIGLKTRLETLRN